MKAEMRILVVDDDQQVREMTADLLQEAGYATVEAADGREAMAALASGGDIAAVITDVVMPGELDGLALARKVLDRRPPLPVLVTSGAFSPRRGDLPGGVTFLQKPYRLGQLVGWLATHVGTPDRWPARVPAGQA